MSTCCDICGCTILHESLVDVHHIIPQEFGGSDSPDNLLTLDVSCHRNLHVFARLYQQNKGSEAESLARNVYNKEDIIKKILEYAKRIASCKVIVPSNNKRKTINVSIKLPIDVYLGIKFLSSRNGMTVPPFLKKFCTDLVRKEGLLRG